LLYILGGRKTLQHAVECPFSVAKEKPERVISYEIDPE
jgi:hypothetical protein